MLTSNDALLTNHDEFRKLAQEHMQYSTRLDSLTQKRYLSEDEKLEEVRLKKLKLRLKDQMQTIEQRAVPKEALTAPAIPGTMSGMMGAILRIRLTLGWKSAISCEVWGCWR